MINKADPDTELLDLLSRTQMSAEHQRTRKKKSSDLRSALVYDGYKCSPQLHLTAAVLFDPSVHLPACRSTWIPANGLFHSPAPGALLISNKVNLKTFVTLDLFTPAAISESMEGRRD